MSTPEHVQQTVEAFLARVDKLPDDFSADTDLYADGVGLDSLETAELSAYLEDELGSDPFSSGSMPQSMGDIASFYAAALSGS